MRRCEICGKAYDPELDPARLVWNDGTVKPCKATDIKGTPRYFCPVHLRTLLFAYSLVESPNFAVLAPTNNEEEGEP